MLQPQYCEGYSCIASFLKSIINGIIVSAENYGVVPWCIIWWIVWFYVHCFYKLVFQNILKRTTIKEEKCKQLIKLYWKIAFASLSIPFALENLNLDYIDISDRFYYVLENHISGWFVSDSSSLKTKMSYVILAGFYLNNISEVCFKFGLYSKEFILNELFGLFFIATYALKCVHFGLAVTVLVNIVDCFMALSSVFVCLGDITQSIALRVYISSIFLTLHVLLWLLIYFHILPLYFIRALIRKLDQRTDAKQLSMLFLLNCAFISYYVLYLLFCPVTNMIYRFVASLQLPLCFMKQEELAESTHTVIEENERNRNIRKKENLRMLYHTVKCAIRMKRKLAKIRKNKLSNSAADNTLNELKETAMEYKLDKSASVEHSESDDCLRKRHYSLESEESLVESGNHHGNHIIGSEHSEEYSNEQEICDKDFLGDENTLSEEAGVDLLR